MASAPVVYDLRASDTETFSDLVGPDKVFGTDLSPHRPSLETRSFGGCVGISSPFGARRAIAPEAYEISFASSVRLWRWH
jgi:hypothetical protein